MNLNSTPRDDSSGACFQHDALESLESRLWDRARRNLRLLYNGGGLAPVAAANARALVGPLVANAKI
jgi:hypothetical protein